MANLDHARLFLQRVLPWPPLGDPNAYFNIHYPTKRLNQAGKPQWTGRACESVAEMVKAVENAMTWDQAVGDVYVCMSSQRIATTRQAANGWSYKTAERSQNAVVHLRSLYVDIDVKDGGYGSTKEAVEALRDFCQASGMPAPTCSVASGSGGLHVYWVLDRALTKVEWQPLADALADATRTHGFKTDTACTVDSARILRVPGTFNHKSDPPNPVTLALRSMRNDDYSVEYISRILKPKALAPVAPLSGQISPLFAQAGVSVQANEAAAGGTEREARPVVLESVAHGCGFIREALETGGRDFANPLWNLTTLAAVFAENGREMAHKMAEGHPSYDKAETEALFERKRKEKELLGLGWPTCKAIQNAGCTSCATCPLRDAGKSPLHLAKTSPVPGALSDDLPPGWMRDAEGRICKRHAQEDGSVDFIPLVGHAMTDPWLQDHPWMLHFTTRDARRRSTQVSIPFDVLGSTEPLARILNGFGFPVTRDQAKKVGDFLVAWIEKLRERRDAVVSSAPFGWMIENGKLHGFVYAGRIWGPNGDRPAAHADPVLSQHYTPCGELDAWKAAAKMTTDQQRPALDVILASSFAAPLMRFTGQSGVLLSAYSTESGIGKTTTLKVAQAVWGSPSKGLQSLSDTTNSVIGKAGTLRHLPLYWDELKTNEETNRFVTFAFQLSQGKEKSRMRADQTQRDPGSWQTLLLAASNDSIVDFITRKTRTTPAGLFRVYEFTVPPAPPSMIQGDAARLVSALEENFGNAGLVYAKFLGENVQEVNRIVVDLHNRLTSKLNATSDERFWVAAMAAVLAGAQLSNKLNLTQINTKLMLEFMLSTFEAMREERKQFRGDLKTQANVGALLAEYLGDMRARNTLTTDIMPVLRGRPPECKLVGDHSRLDRIVVRRATQQGLIRIEAQHFREWAVEKGWGVVALREALKKEAGMQEVVGKLTSGTPFQGYQTYLYQLDTTVLGAGWDAYAEPSMPGKEGAG